MGGVCTGGAGVSGTPANGCMIGAVMELTVLVFFSARALAKANAAAGGSFQPGPLDTGGPWSIPEIQRQSLETWFRKQYENQHRIFFMPKNTDF